MAKTKLFLVGPTQEIPSGQDGLPEHRICFILPGRGLRTFALIVYAHPYCARNSCRNATPRHASSARAEETFQPHIG